MTIKRFCFMFLGMAGVFLVGIGTSILIANNLELLLIGAGLMLARAGYIRFKA